MKSRTLKRATLRKLGACKEYRDEFRRRFGRSVEVTEDLCVSVADVFDWEWAAQHLLSRAARADYERITTAAWFDYDRIRAAARADYERTIAPAWDDYDRTRAAARADYDRITTAAWDDYERIRAPAWARAYINDRGGRS